MVRVSFALKTRLEMTKRAKFDTTFLWLGHEEQMVNQGRADKMPVWYGTLD